MPERSIKNLSKPPIQMGSRLLKDFFCLNISVARVSCKYPFYFFIFQECTLWFIHFNGCISVKYSIHQELQFNL